MHPQNSNIETQYRTLATIWAALLISQLIFLVLIFFAKPEIYRFDFTKPPLPENASIAILALALAGVAAFVMSFILKGKFQKQAIDTQSIEQVQTALIVACAMCEAVALFGVVLAFAFDYQYFFLWFALGIFGIILHFPKRDNLVAASYKKS